MIENSIVYRRSGKYHWFFQMKKAEGAMLWDKDGKEYIDFTSGWNVTNLGWNHPEIAEAVIAQTKKNAQGLLWGSDPVQEEYAARLTAALPKELDACVKATGGTEAIEESIKIARAATGRKKIIGFKNSYHGQLFASLALGSSSEKLAKIAPVVPDVIQLDWPDERSGEGGFKSFLFQLEEVLSHKNVAALVTEPGIVTGWGSTAIAHQGFLKSTRELTRKYGALLIVDEVGTGFSRTGKLFGIEHEQVVPDMIVFAKGISNGTAAIGTVVGRSDMLADAFSDSMLISTFGWTPLACAAALKTLEIHERDKTWELAEQKGNYIMDKLRPLIGSVVVAVRGRGMEIGIELKDGKTAEDMVHSAFERGLHIVVGSGNNLQIMPPLTIPQELLDRGLEILISQLQS